MLDAMALPLVAPLENFGSMSSDLDPGLPSSVSAQQLQPDYDGTASEQPPYRNDNPDSEGYQQEMYQNNPCA